jgi:drug/metabolite transporter (DMT)-like permease
VPGVDRIGLTAPCLGAGSIVSPAATVTGIVAKPRAGMAIGALGVSTSAIFIDLSGTSPATASFYRCVMALPLLVVLAAREGRREGPRSRRSGWLPVVGGLFFTGDMLWWTEAIHEVGAGLSTVLVNAQVVIVPLVALAIDGERPRRRYWRAVPFLVVGVVLTGGVLEQGVSGSSPVWGTVHAVLAAVCYSGFLYLLRRGGQDGRAVQSYTEVIAVAAAASGAFGAFWHDLDLAPGRAALGWLALTALGGGVLGWLLVARSSPRLSSDVGAVLLMLTPVGALVLGAWILGERPSPLQLVGSAIMLASAYAATSGATRGLVVRRRNPDRPSSP